MQSCRFDSRKHLVCLTRVYLLIFDAATCDVFGSRSCYQIDIWKEYSHWRATPRKTLDMPLRPRHFRPDSKVTRMRHVVKVIFLLLFTCLRTRAVSLGNERMCVYCACVRVCACVKLFALRCTLVRVLYQLTTKLTNQRVNPQTKRPTNRRTTS